MASVLIIDDHESTRATYSTILRLSGFDIAVAEDGKAGIELARARDFDVAVVDRRLPDMNGMEVARVLKLNHPLSRIVLVTAFPTIESSFEAAVTVPTDMWTGRCSVTRSSKSSARRSRAHSPSIIPTTAAVRPLIINVLRNRLRPSTPASARPWR